MYQTLIIDNQNSLQFLILLAKEEKKRKKGIEKHKAPSKRKFFGFAVYYKSIFVGDFELESLSFAGGKTLA